MIILYHDFQQNARTVFLRDMILGVVVSFGYEKIYYSFEFACAMKGYSTDVFR